MNRTLSEVVSIQRWQTDYGINICQIITTGASGSEDDARSVAEAELGPAARLSFRKVEPGTLTITYCDATPEA